MTEVSISESEEGAEPGPDSQVDPVVRLGSPLAVGVLLLGFVLRVRGVSEYWLNPDEGIYYSTLTRDSLSAFWAEVSANAHPPLFYLLLRGAGALTWDFVWLRGISVICGTLAIWGVWLVGRELGGKGRAGVVSGLVPAALLAVNGDAITLSQVIRPYMMVLALLTGALYQLLRYRSDPSTRRLVLYSACIVPALLIHYSAALALASLCVVVAYYGLSNAVTGRAWRGLAVVQVLPWVVFGTLYVRHISSTMDSALMGDALGPDGWLSPWLIDSPGDAWFSYATLQVFHFPPDFRGRAALLLLCALVAALAWRRLVAVITGSALAAAAAASVLDLYPFGGSRHNIWLLAFTLPAFGWLVGVLVERGPRPARLGAGALILLLVAGGPVEAHFGTDLVYTNETDELGIRRADIASFVIERMDPGIEPRTVVMTEQSYNILMPLYADEREDAHTLPDSAHFEFSYGARRVVVARKWDWEGAEDLQLTLRAVSSTEEQVLVVAGGWGSALFSDIPELRAGNALLDVVPVLGQDPSGEPMARMVGLLVDPHFTGSGLEG